MVCIYADDTDNADTFGGFTPVEPSFDDRMFLVNFRVDAAVPDDVYLRFSWAYTAP